MTISQSSGQQDTTQANKQAPAALLKHPHLWRAGQLHHHGRSTTGSGFRQLDESLGGGWPEAGLTELLCSSAGIGELRLLAPALRQLSTQQRWIAWVNPPFVPYAPALKAAGIDVDKILLIHPKNHAEALWAVEQASRSGTCSAVLAWFDEKKLKASDTRRLQLASKSGGTLSVLFRPDQAENKASMAELRVRLKPAASGDSLSVDILKRRGGWPVQELQLDVGDIAERRRQREIRQQLDLWRELQSSVEDDKASDVAVREPIEANDPAGDTATNPTTTSRGEQGTPPPARHAAMLH